MELLILEHTDGVDAGWFGDVLDRRGVEPSVRRLHRGDGLPDPGVPGAVLVLGGDMGAYEVDRHPWLEAEKAFLRDVAARGTPTLGICLGCQLLADALGGRAFLAPRPEIGLLRVEVLDRADPVLAAADGPVLVWHQDTWTPPPGAELMARTDLYPQAFRTGSVLGIQFHPETSPDAMERWIADGGTAMFERAGVDPGLLVADARSREDDLRARGRRLFERWYGEAATRTRHRRDDRTIAE